jgi:hypothetical protein
MNERSHPSWPSRAFEGDPVEALRSVEEGLTVRLIATPRDELKTGDRVAVGLGEAFDGRAPDRHARQRVLLMM